MSEEQDEQDLTELRTLMARNAESMVKLRAMLEELEIILATLAADRPDKSTSQNQALFSDDEMPGGNWNISQNNPASGR